MAYRCLRTFYILLLPLIKTPVRKFILIFYFLILFSIKDYVISICRALFFASFLRVQYLSKPLLPRELIQLHMVFKHGHRSPFRIYNTDPNPRELWPEGLGQVTQLGRLQLFVLGRHLKQRYKHFITSNPNEIEMQSSDAFRCMNSAYCFLAGLYPPDEEREFMSNFPWQPIFVNYVPEPDEKYLQSNPNCPKYEACKARVRQSTEVRHFNNKYREFFEYWHVGADKVIINFDNAGDLYKTLSVESDSNLTIPRWALKYWDELVHMADVSYYYHFMTKQQQRLRGGPILGLMLERMKDRIQGNNNQIKVYGYSGHGSNIAAIQCTLLSYDMKHAPHAAIIVLELYREMRGGHTVRFLYYNSSHPERQVEDPFVFVLPGCSEFCPVELFEEFLSDIVPEDWDSECEEDDDKENDFVPIQQAAYFQEKPWGSSSAGTLMAGFTSSFILLIFTVFLYMQ
ncbi:lysosomal acid phosphatase-like [Uloborus diversus]|uniref:lysosomal acid phosphatase-like n=1 Tax=Uloborus diversus TaxID=327109 RepID=UPI00240926E9|nr:lysosomal acid phosphatase-like [Uloborus diversus]